MLRYENKGYDTGIDAPLFRNKHGDPMTVHTYCARIKKLFYDHFLPDLILYCIKTNTYRENAAYIDAYKKEYPGAHMFRHWFTVYLFSITNPELSIGEIMKWRGDKNPESMRPYIQNKRDLMEDYNNAAFRFQREILENIRLINENDD